MLGTALIDVHDAGGGALLLIATSSGPFPERATPQTGYRVDRLRADGTLEEVVDGIAAYPRPGDWVPWWRIANANPPLPELDDGSVLVWTERDVLRIRPDGALTVLWHWDPAGTAPLAP